MAISISVMASLSLSVYLSYIHQRREVNKRLTKAVRIPKISGMGKTRHEDPVMKAVQALANRMLVQGLAAGAVKG